MAELTQFEYDIIRDHAAAADDASNFVCHWETFDAAYNCFAYSVNVTDRYLTPSNMAELDAIYNGQGFFEVPLTSTPQTHDAEVYANGNIPLHAHKIVNPTSQPIECESKMGDGPVITHPWDMLQSGRRTNHNIRRFGVVVRRYRYDPALYERWWSKNFVKTTSGRVINKGDAGRTSSGRIVHRDNLTKTRSGRIVKKTAKSTQTGYARALPARKPPPQPRAVPLPLRSKVPPPKSQRVQPPARTTQGTVHGRAPAPATTTARTAQGTVHGRAPAPARAGPKPATPRGR